MSSNSNRGSGDPGTSSGGGGGGWNVPMAPPPRRPVATANVLASSTSQSINVHQYPRAPPTSAQQRTIQERRNSNNDNHSHNQLKRRHSSPSNHRHRNNSAHHHHHHHHDSSKRRRSGGFNQTSRPHQPARSGSNSSSNNVMVPHGDAAAAAATRCPPPPARQVKTEQYHSLSAATSHSTATLNNILPSRTPETVVLPGGEDDDNNMKPPAAVISNNLAPVKQNNDNSNNGTNTHILFVLDFSSSMLKKDVKTNQKFISRWDAVFECIRTFLAEQLATLGSSTCNKNNAVDKIPKNHSMMIVSVIIFNDTAKTLLERMPLVADGKKVLAALETARKMHKPKGGTGFSVGFARARALASKNGANRHNSSSNNGQGNVVLVFLSDGRPGDLKHEPPSDCNMPMQPTFRRMNQTYPAAGAHIEAMQRAHGDRFSLQLVCLCPEGRSWLRYLADRYKGTFHEPDLALDNDVAPAAAGQMQAVAAMSDYHAVESSDDDDEVLDIVVKSQNTMLREKFNRAAAVGNVHTVASTTMASSQTTSSMRSTFQSISSTVTAMRNGSSSRLQERQVVLAKESPMISYRATRMVLDADHGSISLAPGEQSDGRLVSVSMKPFAQGGLRNVYRMQQSGERPQVAKESRHDIKYQERLKFHIESAMCMAKAKLYVQAFNSHVKQKQQANKGNLLFSAVPVIAFLSAEVYRLKDSKYPGGFRYLAVEPEMNGTYEKWNSNNGFVNNSECTQCLVAQAFSHFSYESSKQEELVVDIQGSGNEFTDPQLHSKTKQFGRADRGSSGFFSYPQVQLHLPRAWFEESIHHHVVDDHESCCKLIVCLSGQYKRPIAKESCPCQHE